MRQSTAVIFVIMVALVAGVVSASDLSGECSLSSTQCDITYSNLQLCNNDNQGPKGYALSIGSDGSGMFNVVPQQRTLDNGQCSDVRVFAVSQCYAKPDNYTSQLVVTSSNEKLTKDCSLNLRQGHNVSVQVAPQEQTATQCEAKVYDLTLTNNSEIQNQSTENAAIKVNGIPGQWYTLEKDNVDVTKGLPEHVKLSVKAPCDANIGTYEFTVRASLVNPDFYSESNGTLTIAQGQNLAIVQGPDVWEGSFAACTQAPSSEAVRITNNGKQQDTFMLSLNAPDFAGLDTPEATIPAGAYVDVPINFSPTSQKPGDYRFAVRATGTNFDYSTTAQFTVSLADCYGVQVKKEEGSGSFCREEAPVYRFSVLNDRSRAIDLNVSLKGISGALSDNNLSLQPSDSAYITAVLDTNGIVKEGNHDESTGIFTLKLDSQYYSYEQDFNFEVYRCHAATMDVPGLELCSGVQKEDSVTIKNTGTQEQDFTMAYAPSWIAGPANVSLAPGESQQVKVTAQTPAGDTTQDTKFTVRAVSDTLLLGKEAPITYLPKEECFGVGLGLPESTIDANSAIGRKYSLFITNRSAVQQKISLASDSALVTFAYNDLLFGPREKKEVNFFVTPPYGFTGRQDITITANTDRGFTATTKMALMEASKEAGANVPAKATTAENGNAASKPGTQAAKATQANKTDQNYTARVEFVVSNDSNSALQIYGNDANILGFSGTVELPSTTLPPGKTATGVLTVELPQGIAPGKISVPVSFATSQGTYKRTIEFDYNAGTATKRNAAAALTTGTGLFSLANLSTAALAGLVVLVILLIAYSAYNSVQNEMKAGQQALPQVGAEQQAGAIPSQTVEKARARPRHKARRGKRKR